MTVTTNGFVSTAQYANDYLAAGLSVIPIHADGSKSPTVSWTPYQSERATTEEANRWFLFDNVGIAIVHGKASGNSELIDVDNADVFMPFCEELYRLDPDLIEKLTLIKTPRPGYHLVYRCAEIGGNQKLAIDADGKCLIETRGQGGYALAPGSPGECHETGRTYEHYDGPQLTELPTITVEERAILFRVAATFNEAVDEDYNEPARDGFNSGVSPGDDYGQRTTWDEILSPHGWTLSHASGDKSYWRRPGKDSGWSATTGCKSKSGNDLLCVFSTNAQPFEGATVAKSCTSYSKFAAHAVLNYSGDYSATAKQLSADGYGDRPKTYKNADGLDDEAEHDGNQTKNSSPANRLKSLPLREFIQQDFSVDCLINGVVIAGQPGIIAAKSKSQKTTILLDACLSMATATPFMGKWNVPKAINVGVLSGESGGATIAETFRRIAKAKRVDPLECRNLHVSTDIPALATAKGITEIERFIDVHELKFLGIDPTYLATAGIDDNSLSQMASVLAPLSSMIERTGCSIMPAHHNRKNSPAPYGEPTLSEITGSGWAQWARYWVLLNKRREWEPDEGRHWLWMCTGSSSGFGSRHWLDVFEGRHTDPEGRTWHLEFTNPAEGAEREKEDRQFEKETGSMERDRSKVCAVLAKHPDGLTKTKMFKDAKVSQGRWNVVLETMLDEDDIVHAKVGANDRKTPRDGFKLAGSNDP